jgi:hypothetical protein
MASDGSKSIIPKLILAIGGAGALALGGYAVYNYVAGQTCSASPGSPCYQYTQAYQTCLNQYITANKQFLLEDQAAGVGYTQEQITYLNNLQTCMNNAAKNIYSTTKSLNLPITQAIFAIAAVVASVLVARGLMSAYIKLKLNSSPRVVGSDTASAVRQSTIQDALDNGEISPETASDMADTNSSMTSDEISQTQATISDISETLTEDEAAIVSEYTDQSVEAVDSATEEVNDELVGLSG